MTDESTGGSGAFGGIPEETWRALLLALLERVEQTVVVLTDDDADPFARVGQAKEAFDSFVVEFGDVLARLIAQVIALLEEAQIALAKHHAEPPEPPRAPPGSRFQTIAVTIES